MDGMGTGSEEMDEVEKKVLGVILTLDGSFGHPARENQLRERQ